MEDRELLELAAKAAGIDHPGGEHCLHGPALWDCTALRWGKPLTDDGDALRLAVNLNLMVDVNDEESRTFALGEYGLSCEEFHLSDPCAATRRAIVRAAAEIGKGMP